jgi:hypothetical protein
LIGLPLDCFVNLFDSAWEVRVIWKYPVACNTLSLAKQEGKTLFSE